jgi:osmoprotectant transport system permease protein
MFFAIPPILTNTYVGMTAVDRDVKEAARGMGMTGVQLLRKVELPLALPLVAAGIRTAVVQVIATATLAAVVGSGGLGRFVYDGFSTHQPGVYLGGATVVIALAVLVEAVLGRLQRALERRLGRSPAADVPQREAAEAQLTPVP